MERSGFETLPSQCVKFLGKALLITLAVPLMILSTQEYKMGTGKLSGKPDEMQGGNLAMELASHPEGRGGKRGGGRGRGEEGGGEEGGGKREGGKREGGRGREGVVILLVASYYIETGISSGWMGKDSLLW